MLHPPTYNPLDWGDTAGTTTSYNIVTDSVFFKTKNCGCYEVYSPITSDKLKLKCFGCEKPLCKDCAIISRKENNAGIWCKDCEQVCQTFPFTKAEIMDKLYSILVDSNENVVDPVSETQAPDTPKDND